MAQHNRELSEPRAVREEIAGALRDVHTVFPASVVTFTPAKGPKPALATVQPHFKFTTPGGDVVPLPPIADAPVMFPASHGFAMTWPLIPGDLVAVFVAEQSLDSWIDQGAPVDPCDTRRHDLSDVFVCPTFPGMKTQPYTPDPLDAAGVNVRLARFGPTPCAVKMKPNGSIVLEKAPTPGAAIVLGSEASARSPLPQESFLLWLTATFTAVQTFLSAAIADPTMAEHAATKAALVTLQTALVNLLKQFVQDAPPPAGTGIGYHCKSDGVKIP